MNRLSLSLVISFLISIGFSQDLPLPKNLQSPNASSLGKYGDVPVSYNRGTPNIAVPLYSINEYGVPLNISLNYDASGVRVNSMPGWVGQNWSLNAGGVITRTVRGSMADEMYISGNTQLNYFGYMSSESRDLVNVPNWNTPAYFDDLTTNVQGLGDPPGARDFEPDIFTFNFMGKTGKFFFGEDGEWKVSSGSNIKIIIDTNDNTYPFNEQYVPFNEQQNPCTQPGAARITTKTIYKIKIIDDKGVEYTFGNTDNSVEYDVGFLNQASKESWTATAWYLTEVKNRFGKIIYEFEYERGEDYIASLYRFFRYSQYHSYSSNGPGTSPECANGFFQSAPCATFNGRLISPVYLSKIVTLHGDITFNRNLSNGLSYKDDQELINSIESGFCPYMAFPAPNCIFTYLYPYSGGEDLLSKLKWQKLTSINGLRKNITLSYNDIPTTPPKRLFLNNVNINDELYSFEYDDPDALPKYLDYKVDHWGFYDGSYSYTNAMISNSQFTSYFNERNPSASFMKKGILKKITYPTKGWTDFIWEPHRYSKVVNDNKSGLQSTSNTMAGGLRIKEIRDNDDQGNEIIKEYFYVKNYQFGSSLGSGILNAAPKYYWNDFTLVKPNGDTYKEDIFSTIPLIPLSNSFGSHIEYSEVVEKRQGNGYTIYKYTSNEIPEYRDEYVDNTVNQDATPYMNFNDRSLLRGNLMEINTYNVNNELKSKQARIFNHDNTKYVRGINITSTTYTCSAQLIFDKGNAYKTYYFDNNLTSEESYVYEDGEELKTQTEYTWAYYPSSSSTVGDQFLQSKKVQTYSLLGNSDQEFYQENYRYNYEESSVVNNDLVAQNYFTVVQTDRFKNSTRVSGTRLEYDYFGPNILPARLYSSKGSDGFELRTVIDEYNVDELVQKYHTTDGLYTYILNIDNYPTVKVEGKEFNSTEDWYLFTNVGNFIRGKVNTIGWNGSRTAIVNKQQEARNYFSRHMLSSYTYNPNIGISSMTDSRGYTTYYNYDANNRLSNIRDDNYKTLQQFLYNFKSE